MNHQWKMVPVEPTAEMETAAEDDYEQTGATFPRWKSAYAAMLEAAPAPPASAQDDAKDDSIALDKLADYIADNWPDKKYGLEEICQRLNATWPGAFMPPSDAPAAGDARDAERYRWLRDHFQPYLAHSLRWYLPWGEARTAEGLDACLDAALSASQQQEG